MLLTDPSHAIPVEISRNGLRAIAQGTGDAYRLELSHLPRNADVVEGDLLVTSGLGGRFPPGYPVARVTNIERRMDSLRGRQRRTAGAPREHPCRAAGDAGPRPPAGSGASDVPDERTRRSRRTERGHGTGKRDHRHQLHRRAGTDHRAAARLARGYAPGMGRAGTDILVHGAAEPSRRRVSAGPSACCSMSCAPACSGSTR
jgi:hypothetical protein